MAKEEQLRSITLAAGADLSAKQFYFVEVNSSGAAVLAGDGENAVGVLQNDPTSGNAATVGFFGVTKVKAGGTVTAGGFVASDTNGKAVTAATGDIILGTFLEGGVSNDLVSILFHPRGAAT